MLDALLFIPKAHAADQNTKQPAFTIETLVSPENSNFVARSQRGILTARQQWNLRTTVGAYKQVGQRDPKWDMAAIEALESFALSRGVGLNEEVKAMQRRIGVATTKVRSLGCRDPLIEYLWFRFNGLTLQNSTQDFAASEYERCARNLATSGYPAIRKFFVCNHALERYHEMRSYPPEIESLVNMAADSLGEALKDKELPAEDAYLFCESFLIACRQAKKDSHAVWIKLEPAIKAKLNGTYHGFVIEGLVNLRWAWDARGTGWANEVTDEGWKSMKERLRLAQKALDRAWALNPKDWRGPNLMMEVVFLQSGDRDTMDVWFNRAMQNNTNNYAACAIKLNFMTPRWGGTEEEMIAFGRRCLTNTLWTPSVAKILPKVYEELSSAIPEAEEKRKYWARNWTDIRSAYERLLRAYPDNSQFQADFAHWCFLCGRKVEAERILPK